jgi:serine/threonine protein kinase
MDTLAYEQGQHRRTEGMVLSGTYRIERRIGHGGMGDVYLASHARLPGRFAVKILLPELVSNQEAFARFCREAEIMSQLRHPNIVQIFDFDNAPDGRPYFVMEYLEGRDLESRLAVEGALPLPTVVRIVGSISSALAAAHGHGVVHRDLKPANVFLATVDGQTDEVVKVLDFGISKVRSAARLSEERDLLGTPPYMAPEQARGRHDAVDGRTDQFALGAITYRMLTGRDPFQGDDPAALLYQVVHEDPPPLATLVPASWDPGPLQAVLDRAMAKRPESRWGGMLELARAFESAAEHTLHDGDDRVSEPPASEVLDTPPPVRLRALPRPTPTPVPTPLVRRKQQASMLTPTPEVVVARGPASMPTPAPEVTRRRKLSATPTPTPIETLEPEPIRPITAIRREPTPAPEPEIDWTLPPGIDRVPRRWGAIVAIFLLAVVGVAIATGWYQRIPGWLTAARDAVQAKLGL